MDAMDKVATDLTARVDTTASYGEAHLGKNLSHRSFLLDASSPSPLLSRSASSATPLGDDRRKGKLICMVDDPSVPLSLCP
uniref:Uncharacterized protein n=1 Tax=Arundo donax TaxID=35708 RepID=A0A0A9GU53_ARUDO